MKKIGLIGLFIVSTLCADPAIEETQPTPEPTSQPVLQPVPQPTSQPVPQPAPQPTSQPVPTSQTTIEKAKTLILQALAISKEKTVQSYQWARNQMPAKETVKESWNNSLSWLSAKSIIAKNWLTTEAPVKAHQLISTVKTSCKPAWEKTRTTLSSLIAALKPNF